MLYLDVNLSGTVTSIQGLKNLVDDLEASVRIGSKEAVSKAAELVYDSVVQSIKNEGLVASGDFLASVTTSGMTASTDQFEITVGSTSPYASYIEEGSRAGGARPPTQVIYEWMVSKGIEPSYRSAYIISKSIQEKGIAPKRPFEKGVKNATPLIDFLADAIIEKNLKDKYGNSR